MSTHAYHSWEGTYQRHLHPEAAVPSGLASISTAPASHVSTMLNPSRRLLSHATGWSLDVSQLTASREERSAGWCMIERFLDRTCVQLAHQPATHAALVNRQQDLAWSTGKEMLENLLQLAHVQVHVQRGSVHKTGCGGMFCQWVHSFNLKVFLQGQDIAVQVAQVARTKHDNEQITAQATEGVNHLRAACLQPCQDPPSHRPTTSKTRNLTDPHISLCLQATSGVYHNLLGFDGYAHQGQSLHTGYITVHDIITKAMLAALNLQKICITLQAPQTERWQSKPNIHILKLSK